MLIVHQTQLYKFSTFGEFAGAFFKKIIGLLSQPYVQRVDVVFDRYDDISIKFLESKLRAKGQTSSKIIISSSSTKITMNCKEFFANLENKV